MALSFQECLQKMKELHPDLYPVWYIEHQGKYLFNMLKRGVNREEAVMNLFPMDPESGFSGGALPVLQVYDNEALTEKLQHPHMIHGEDQQIVHGATYPINGAFEDALYAADNVFLHAKSLSHHGIKGMKWGVRRFQNEDGSLTAAGKERYRYSEGQGSRKLLEKAAGDQKAAKEKDPYAEARRQYISEAIEQQKALQKHMEEQKKAGMGLRQRALERDAFRAEQAMDQMEKMDLNQFIDRDKSKEGHIDKTGVAVNVLATVVNPMNAVFLAKEGVDLATASYKMNSYLKKREQNSELDPETGLYKKKEGQYSEKADLAAVNPGFKNLNTNSKSNCMLCTTTYDLRKRGYDVTAQLDSNGYNFNDLKRWYPDAKYERNGRRNAAGVAIGQKEYVKNSIDSLAKQGNGARGNIMVWFTTGGGHSICYEVQNGKVLFKDGQANKVYKPEKILNMTSFNTYARLDNIQPDLKMIKKECVR